MNADRLPVKGRERVAAINRLHRVLADDFANAAVLLDVEVGLTEDDIVLMLNAHRQWWHAVIDEAHAEAVAYVRWAAA